MLTGAIAIDHFHYDVTRAKVSGSCSKDRAQGHSIAGKFKIIHKNTCNAMAPELVDRLCAQLRGPRVTLATNLPLPHQDTSRDNNVKVRKLYFCKIFDFFFKLIVSHSVRYKTF